MEAKATEEEKSQLTDEIVSLSADIYEFFMMARADAWSRVHLTMLQFKVLVGVCLGRKVGSPRLGRQLGVSPSSLTRVVDQLVKRGLAQRQEDPSDRRVVYLQGTDNGRQLVHSLTDQTMPAAVRAALGGLSVEDLLVLRDAARITNQAVRKARPAGGRPGAGAPDS